MNDAMQRAAAESPSVVRRSSRNAATGNTNPELEPNAIVERNAAFVDPELRLAMVAEAAYYCAEHRGFDPGHDIEDWCTAEAQVDEALGRGNV